MSADLVHTTDALAACLARWQSAPFLALDTEFVRETTYYPQLCLIQVSDGADSICLDALALDLAPLFALLRDPQRVHVFHAAGQDLEIFVQRAGAAPGNFFDTQIAAALLGQGEQLGYAALVEKRCGVKLDKSLSRTDWSRRPLRAAEIAYAADDVRYLASIYPTLRDELIARGRLHWLMEDCAALADPARYRVAPQNEWKRLKGLPRLDARAQHVAASLAAWREIIAEQRDRPRRWILADDALYALAERRPQSAAQLAQLQVLPPKTLERHGEELLAQIAQAAKLDAPPLALEARATEREKAQLKHLLERARAIASTLGIPPSLLAPRADVEALAQFGETAPVTLLRGWRRAVAGEELLALATA